MKPKALIDFTDKELRIALQKEVEHVQYSAANYYDELNRRSQTRWTTIVGIATVINTIVAVILLLKTFGCL